MTELVFLKLGGSLITDKDLPYTPRLDKLTELAQEIKAALFSDRLAGTQKQPGVKAYPGTRFRFLWSYCGKEIRNA